MDKIKKEAIKLVAFCSVLIAVLLVFGTMWMGSSSKKDSDKAVRTVSLLYLDELAGRREQVVENNLKNNIRTIEVAINLLTDEDLSDKAHLEAYQSHMKKLYSLDKFAFVDTEGLIYTSVGTQSNIGEYDFDYKTISEPEVSVFNLKSPDKKVVIAVPVAIPFEGKTFSVCFMEIDMKVMLAGVSMDSGGEGATFCNIYTQDGIALTNTVLGGLSADDNLISAMKKAQYDDGYSYDRFKEEFQSGKNSEVSFTYRGIKETLSFVPVVGTDWLLTYLIRESVISDSVGYVTTDIIERSIVQSLITVAAIFAMFAFVYLQSKRNNKLMLEQKTAEALIRGKQAELERSLSLQRQLEEQRKIILDALTTAEEANKAKTTFLSNMSHEIRTPMNAIIGFNTLAMKDEGLPEKTQDYLSKIDYSAKHLLGIINDILDMSRIEAGRTDVKHEEFSFREFINQIGVIIAGQCEGKGLKYVYGEVNRIDDSFIGDDLKLKQVIINILGNSVKFTDAPGTVTFTVEQLDNADDSVTLRFKMEDTGIGMDKEYIPKLFEAFSQEDEGTTTSYGGNGLGMAITKKIVDMMGGDIQLESEKGVGTTVTVSVALDKVVKPDMTDAADGGKEALAADIPLDGKHVLIAEDQEMNAEILTELLEMEGVTSELADNGKIAVEMFEQSKEGHFDAILMDMRMPVMDGLTATREIRKLSRPDAQTIPIIAMTANAFDDDVKKCLEAGMNAHCAKPVDMERLKAELSRCILENA